MSTAMKNLSGDELKNSIWRSNKFICSDRGGFVRLGIMRAICRLPFMIPLIVASISYSFGVELAPNEINFEEARERTMMEDTLDNTIDDTDSPYSSKMNVDSILPESRTYNKRGIAVSTNFRTHIHMGRKRKKI